MLNQVVIVGRIANDIKIEKTESGKKYANITLAVTRPFKNMDGEYDTDFISCILWQGIAQNTMDYCNKDDLVGVKGRLETMEDNRLVLQAEKVTFLSSSRKEENKESEEK